MISNGWSTTASGNTTITYATPKVHWAPVGTPFPASLPPTEEKKDDPLSWLDRRIDEVTRLAF